MKENLLWPDKSTVLHLRLPFSFFLLPVFMFALSTANHIHWPGTILAFFILHFLMFPSSNGYNSYQDHDESSIGGLRNPPPVSQRLYYTTLVLDIMALLLGLLISVLFTLLVMLFITVSRAYSYRAIRLKRYPYLSFLIVSVFQGGLVYLISLVAVLNINSLSIINNPVLLGMAISSTFIGSVFPLTQIYQHQSDKNDGVISISYKLGYTGTFIFSSVLFMIANVLVYIYYENLNQLRYFYLFLFVMLPVIFWFLWWFVKVVKNKSQANYSNTMLMNMVTSSCMNFFFLFLTLNRYGSWY